MKRFIYLILLVTFSVSCKSQEIAVNKIILPDTLKVRIILAGDVMGHMPQINAAWVDTLKTYDFLPVFENVKDYISKADIAIANLEVPLAGKPYSGYPQFSSPDELGTALKTVGFDALIMANNHAVDRGKKGVIHTLHVLDSLDIKHTGVFKDTAERRKKYPLFFEVNKIKIALLNYTYGTNGIKPEKPIIVNYIDTTAIKRDLEMCRKRNADFIIATVHWGTEYERFSNKEQRTIANYLGKNGANAIIGSHPHVVEPFNTLYPFPTDSLNCVPVIYSVGNFFSNQRDRYRDGGIIFELNIQKITRTDITSVGFVPVWVYKGWYNERIIYRLVPPAKFEETLKKYNISNSDSIKCTDFYNDTREHLGNLKEINITE